MGNKENNIKLAHCVSIIMLQGGGQDNPAGLSSPRGGQDKPAGISYPPGGEDVQGGGQDIPGQLAPRGASCPGGQDKLLPAIKIYRKALKLEKARIT